MKNEFKQQKTSISVTKRVFSVLVAVVVLAFSIVNVCAVNTNPSWNFESANQPLVVSQNPINGESYKHQRFNTTYYDVRYTSTKSNTYACATGYLQYFMCAEEFEIFANYGYTDNVVHWYSSWNNTYNAYTIRYNESFNCDAYYEPTYETEQECYEALADIVNNPYQPPSNGNTLNISLPAGNVLIADISNTGSNPYYMETTSGTTGAVVKPGMNNIQIGYSNTVPSSFAVPNSSWDYPSWSGSGSVSVLGTYNRQSTQGDFALSNNDAMKYVIITNPMYPNDNNASANRLNSDLSIRIDKVNSYVIYSLQTGYVSGNLVGTNDGSQYIDYEYDEDTGEWVGTNQDGDPASPVWGGQNDFENTPTTINDWLENIAHQITSFFSGAIGAITTLSVAIKNFAGTLMSLYVWLPSPVLSILSSAVMLAIVIGVIKVFI